MIQALIRYIFDTLWCDKTHMVYDFRPTGYAPRDFSHLPPPELIAMNVPNPNGWSTGMEDCMLNAGLLASAAARLGDARMAQDIYKGMHLCANVSPREGFLPRGVSPIDGVSHYIDTSRDQYTDWVWGACRLYDAQLLSAEQMQQVGEDLSRIARRMEQDVTEENDYFVLREDGQHTVVCRMWGELGAHEAARLPMIYLAAYHVTQNAHWRDRYLQYRDEALERSQAFARDNFWHTYSALQMTLSLRLIHDHDGEPAVQAQCAAILRRLSDMLEPEALQAARVMSDPDYHENYNYIYTPWDKAPARFAGIHGGKPYYNHGQCLRPDNLAFYPLRDLGDTAALLALAPDRPVPPQLHQALLDVAANIDLQQHCTAGPVDLLHGLVLTATL